MVLMIKLFGRWEYNLTWVTDLLFPSWVLELSIVDFLVPDVEEILEKHRNFDLLTWFTGNDLNPLEWVANDWSLWLAA